MHGAGLRPGAAALAAAADPARGWPAPIPRNIRFPNDSLAPPRPCNRMRGCAVVVNGDRLRERRRWQTRISGPAGGGRVVHDKMVRTEERRDGEVGVS